MGSKKTISGRGIHISINPKILIIIAILLFAGASVFYLGVHIGKQTEQPFQQQVIASQITPQRISTKIVAIDNAGKGVTADLITEVKPGTGLVLVNINKVLADANAQYSARLAAQVAKNLTKRSFDNVDIIFDIEANANVVGGQSAGSVMTVSAYAALVNKSLNPGVFMTGTIEPDGTIGDVGAVAEKALAAKDAGATLFIVPKGMATKVKEVKKKKDCGLMNELEYCKIRYIEETTNLGEEIGIQLVEVGKIEEALQYYIKDDAA